MNVKGGETETLNIIFAKSVNVVRGPTDAAAAPASWYENPWLWVAVGVVVVGGGTAGIIAATSSGSQPNPGSSGVVFKP